MYLTELSWLKLGAIINYCLCENTFPPSICKQSSPPTLQFDHKYPQSWIYLEAAAVITQTFGFLSFRLCNYIFLPEAIGYTHVVIALGWSVSGIIKVVEMSENDWSDFGLTRLYFRLIVMWLGMGIRIVWVQKEPQDGQRCPLNWEDAAISSHLNFSPKREGPFWILWCSPLNSSLWF